MGLATLARAGAQVLTYAILIGLVAALWRRPWLLAGLLLVLAAVMLWRWHERSDVLFFALSAIFGPLGEIVCIHSGAWEYGAPSLGFIPPWLPLGWGIAGLFLKRLVATLDGKG
jgi:hypothetical protein